MAHRISINTVDAGDRQALVDLMLQYLTDDIVDDHMNIIHSGLDFFTGHRAYIGAMEAWLAVNGGAQFVPLPEWIPENPIPAEFNVVKGMDDGTPRDPLVNLNPNMPVPAEIAPGQQLCSFPSGDDLANSINGWHGSVHVTIGGAMGDFMNASAAPIFWCWHAFLDDVYYDWEACQIPEDGDRPYGHGHPAEDEYEHYKHACEERKAHYEEYPLEKFDEKHELPLYRAPVPSYQSKRT